MGREGQLSRFRPVDTNGHVDKSFIYSGHHPSPVPDRRFNVDLQVERKIIFQGVVSFGLGRDIALVDSFRVSEGFSVSSETIRGGKIVPEDSDAGRL